jgi:gluconate 5-dehydrogenase
MNQPRTVGDLFDMGGEVAIVTGATGQLGGQMADALAEAGAHVVVASRTESDCERKATELSSKHAEALAVPTDVTDPESVENMVNKAVDRFGGVDVLVNNAYSGTAAPFEEITLDDWNAAFEGAVTSTFLCSQAVAPVMVEQESGSIVNVGSIYGTVAPDHSIYGETGLNNPANYGPAKAAVVQFTRWLAAYLAEDGVRVNCISPGGFYDEDLEDRPGYEETFVPNYRDRTPLGRMGDDTDLKGPIVFLASDASEWVTGHNLLVDGGWTVW